MNHTSKRRKWIILISDIAVMHIMLWSMQSFSIPAETLANNMNYSDHYYSAGDTVIFSGYRWVTKESNERHTGPGRNFFAGGKENVWVDEQGRLHLRMTNRNGRWYCAEARLVESLGYGQYIFSVEANSLPLDKNLVVGFFTYDHDDTLHHHREIDLEFSTWGKETDLNSQYVIQPADIPENVKRFSTDLSKATEHSIIWRKTRISFTSRYPGEKDSSVYTTWRYKPSRGLKPNSEKFSINIWLDNTDYPSNYNDYEIVVTRFQFLKHRFLKFN